MSKLYTIGYATQPIDIFIKHLKKYAVTVVADIRSVPYSKVFIDYHQQAIAEHLKKHHIRYVYLGEELGPRSKDSSHYDKTGQVQFIRLMQSNLFLNGIDRLKLGLKKEFHIALMCAEKDPASCHRSLLVGYFLKHNQSIDTLHITYEGELESQSKLEQRLLELHDTGADLFMSQQEREQQAYNIQLQKTSYRKN